MNQGQVPQDQRNRSVLMLVNTHVYDDPRVISEATTLVQAGYQVAVIGAARLGGVPVRKNVEGIEIVLVPMVINHVWRSLWQVLRGKMGITTAQPPSAQTTILSLLFFNMWCLRLGWKYPAQVIHSHDLSPLPVASLLAFLRRTRLIYDSHESAADFYRGQKGQFMARLERMLIGRPQAVITVGERLGEALRERGARRVVIVGNWKRPELYQMDPASVKAKRQELRLEEARLIITFIGDLTRTTYELAPLLSAIESTPEVTLIIAGRGNMESEIVAAAQRASNIRWLGWLPITEVPLYTKLADVIYCCTNPDFPQVKYAVPNKLFEAFMAGRAILARRGVGEMGQILERIPAALLLDDVTPQSLRAAFHELQQPTLLKRLQAASQQGRAEFNWGVAQQRLLDLYAELIPYGLSFQR